jgi:N,N-dimethylformamidase
LGFSAHGFSGDGAYRLNLDLPLSRLPPRLRSACEGLQADFGVAGLELDRYDVALGSPADAIVLARASRLPSGYVPAVEDIIALDALLPDPSAALADAAKGDIILMRNAGGGYCFSVGSIRWTNGLTDSTDSRHVRDITGAVLFDLLDDASIRRES